MGAESETYTIMFRFDRDNEVYMLAVTEHGRAGDPLLVNQMDGEQVLELYECLTGRNFELEDDY